MAVQVSWEGCNVQLADLQLEIALQFIATTYLAWRGAVVATGKLSHTVKDVV